MNIAALTITLYYLNAILVLCFVDQLVSADPRHHAAQFCACVFDRVFSLAFANFNQTVQTFFVATHEVLNEFT